MVLGVNNAFLAAIGRAKAQASVVCYSHENDAKITLSCNGRIIIRSIVNGEPTTDIYNDLDNTMVYLSSDADTKICIYGDVTLFSTNRDDGNSLLYEVNFPGAKNITYIDLADNIDITGLDISNNPNLEHLNINGTGIYGITIYDNNKLKFICINNSDIQYLDFSKLSNLEHLECLNSHITALDLSHSTALEFLECGGAYLQDIDLSANAALTTLSIMDGEPLTVIKYAAGNSDVSDAIAQAITDADSDSGTVYTDSQGAYYSTIADAATAKGWTIEQL